MAWTNGAAVDLAPLVDAATYITLRKPIQRTELILCGRYLDRPALLAEAWVPIGIRERAGQGGPEDQRADASMWLRYYAAAVATLPLMALAAGMVVDLSPARSAVMIYDGVPTRAIADPARVPPAGEVREGLRGEVFANLFEKHLLPLVDRMLNIVKLDPRVLWSDVGESVDCLYAAAVGKVVPDVAEAIESDRRVIFGDDRLPGVERPNPLKGTILYPVDAPEIYPHAAQVREMCCVVFHVRTPKEYCRNCPLLTPPERATKMREWSLQLAERPTS
jgi:ferric iron reductase protein FhuF